MDGACAWPERPVGGRTGRADRSLGVRFENVACLACGHGRVVPQPGPPQGRDRGGIQSWLGDTVPFRQTCPIMRKQDRS